MKNIKHKISVLVLLLYSIASFGQEESGSIFEPISYNGQNTTNAVCPCRPTYTYSQLETDVMNRINQHRQSIGLSTLSVINHISNNCLDHNNYMIAANVTNHDNFLDRANNIICALNAGGVDEIVASNFVSAAGVVNAWLGSPPHRAAIETASFTRMGVSVRANGAGKNYYTVLFTRNTSGSCAVLTNLCSLTSPVTLTTSNISFNSAQLNWSNVIGNAGYQIEYKTTSSSLWISAATVGTNVVTYTLSGLNPTTAYDWRIRTRCANGLYGLYGNSVNFTTICADNLNFSSAIFSGQTITKEASISITSSSIVNNGGTGIFHAGNSVTFTTNFNAISGSTFRAYIEGCSGSFVAKSAENSVINEEEKATMLIRSLENKVKIIPNPNSGIFNLSLDNIHEGVIEISDLFGSIVYKSNFKNQSEQLINIQNRPKGIYIVKVYAESGSIYANKMIKN
ncbi:3-coathanger stack domain-containing protein [Flavobacterium sp.]|uniref:3-coathanger stack domain-containing protein n=1 Tax=Flavobacterium sp. TaxID=239 RepID=UPI002606729B|nr:3-coathanger stack domain-containing protein [Flavobacterium sp.]